MKLYLETERFLQMSAADPSLLDNSVNFISGEIPRFRLERQLTECSDDELLA
jgi:hypothetical protein